PGAADPPEEEEPEPDDQQDRQDPADQLADPPLADFTGVADLLGVELLGKVRVLDAHGRERRTHAVLVEIDAADGLGTDAGFGNAPLCQQRLERGVLEPFAAVERGGHRVGEQQQAEENRAEPEDAGRAPEESGSAWGLRGLIGSHQDRVSAAGASVLLNTSPDVPTSTVIASPSRKRPSSTASASGSSSRRCSTRRSGRAPYTGS